MAKKQEQFELRCSFCSKTQGEVEFLVAGPLVYICDGCVAECADVVVESRAKKSVSALVEEVMRRITEDKTLSGVIELCLAWSDKTLARFVIAALLYPLIDTIDPPLDEDLRKQVMEGVRTRLLQPKP